MRRVNSYNIIEPFSCHVYSAYSTTDVSPCTLFSWGDMYVYVFQSTCGCVLHMYIADLCIVMSVFVSCLFYHCQYYY